jgi:cytochrome c oxidase subunit III
MKQNTAVDLKESVSKSRINIGGTSGSSGGDNRGDFRKDNPFGDHIEGFNPDKFRILMWFLLLIVFMTFGGLIAAYIVLATNKAMEWHPFNLPFQVWVSTAIIIISSITYELSNRHLKSGNQSKSRKFLLISTGLGAAFIASQILAWLQLVNLGYYLSGNPFAGLFYILTATHALHVVGGIIALSYIVLKTEKTTLLNEELFKRQTNTKIIGWYWHFMGGLWLVLVLLLGYWR